MNKKITTLLLTLAAFLVSHEISNSDITGYKSRKQLASGKVASLKVLKSEIKKITEKEKKLQAKTIFKEEKTIQKDEYRDVKKLNFSNPIIKSEKIADTKSNNSNKIQKQKDIKKEISEYSLKKRIIKSNHIETKLKTKIHIEELNMDEPVKLYGFHKTIEIRKSNWENSFKMNSYGNHEEKSFKLNQIAKNTKNNNKETIDRISTAQAANEKSKESNLPNQELNTQPKITKKSEPKAKEVTKSESIFVDDLVFFDYAAEEENEVHKEEKKVVKVKTINLGNSALLQKTTTNFQNFIASESKDNANKASSKADYNPPKVASNDQDQKALQNAIASLTKNGDDKKETVSGFAPEKVNRRKISKRTYKSDYSIFTYSVGLKNKINDHKNFEIRFKDDVDDIRQDYGKGKIELKDKLSSSMAVRRGTILSSNHYPTTVDFVFEQGEIAATIPIFTRQYLDKIIKDEGVTGLGAQLLVELDDTTEDIDLDLDTKYEKKVFLNKNLKVVSRDESDYSFIMLLGVRPGNTILSFRTTKNKYVSKIVHLEQDEVYFDSNFYINKEIDDFSLFEEKLLSKTKLPLSLDSKEIKGLTFETEVVKQTINQYKMKNVKYPLGTRSYIELKHLKESVFVGRWDGQDIDVPSETYMRFVLDQFNLQGVSNQCLVQVNLKKSAKELYFNGQSTNRSMRMQAKILDKDGMFYEDLSHESKKIFLMGEEQGIVNIKLVYTDNSVDYLQSYCSQATYLVEQL